jgi:hypothetical protein
MTDEWYSCQQTTKYFYTAHQSDNQYPQKCIKIPVVMHAFYMPSTTNLEGEEIVDAPGKDGNALMPEQVQRPNPWRNMMMTTTKTTMKSDNGSTGKIALAGKN